MISIPEDPIASVRSRDPVRLVVHAVLALYISPVILLVCLIGGLAILVEKGMGLVMSVARGSRRRHDYRPSGIGKSRVAVDRSGASRSCERGRSRIAR